jgi:hypothetical protein
MRPCAAVNILDGGLSLAGFQVTIIGRFWMSAEAAGLPNPRGILLELMSNLCDEGGLGHLGERLAPWFEPAAASHQSIGVGGK